MKNKSIKYNINDIEIITIDPYYPFRHIFFKNGKRITFNIIKYNYKIINNILLLEEK